MDEKFLKAIETVLRHEGGYSNHPADPGGATNFGISLRFLQKLREIDPDDGYLFGDMDHDGDVDADDIRHLDRDEAVRIYESQWWDRYCYGMIIHAGLATKIFDFSVNMGPGRAHRLVQQAVNRLGPETLVVDGMLGIKSFNAINRYPHQEFLLASLRLEAIGFYNSLRKPEFIAGWINRALD